MFKFLFSIIFLHFWCFVYADKLHVGSCRFYFSEKCFKDVIKVYLFSGQRPQQRILLNADNITIPEFVSLNYTNKLLVHGYGGNVDFFATKSIRNAYLLSSDVNVFVVDWGYLAKIPCYPAAAYNTRYVAKCVADLLIRLSLKYKEFIPYDVHIIGFSLGAHLASFISNQFAGKIGDRVTRITGLDPALPFFATSARHAKLDPSDADFVDVIHSNAGIFGKIEACGDIDFYVNGGQFQPACNGHRNLPLCSHIFSTVYFAESINSDIGFWGTPCYSYLQYMFGFCSIRSPFAGYERVLMGEYSFLNTLNPKSSIIIIETNTVRPYALGL